MWKFELAYDQKLSKMVFSYLYICSKGYNFHFEASCMYFEDPYNPMSDFAYCKKHKWAVKVATRLTQVMPENLCTRLGNCNMYHVHLCYKCLA